MLQTLRKNAKFFYFLFVLIIISFIFWGIGTADKQTIPVLAEVGSEKILLEDFWRTYDRVRENYRQALKEQFTAEFEKSLNLKDAVLSSMIDEKILLLSAKDLNIPVTDKELQEVITNDPNFKRDGVFRKDVYFKTLELNRITVDQYEKSLRQQILIAKMRALIGSLPDVAPHDLAGTDKQSLQITNMILSAKQDATIQSYINAMKQKIPIKIKKELISGS